MGGSKSVFTLVVNHTLSSRQSKLQKKICIFLCTVLPLVTTGESGDHYIEEEQEKVVKLDMKGGKENVRGKGKEK